METMVISDVGNRREAVTAINVFDRANGIRVSQGAKYEKPIWYFVLAVLPGADKEGITVNQILRRLAKHGVFVSQVAVNRVLNIMIHKDASIHPYRRNCGIGCYEAVSKMGDIQSAAESNGNRGCPPGLFWLGADTYEVNKARRAFHITMKP